MAFKENIKTQTYDTGRFRKITWQYRASQIWPPFFEELDCKLVNSLLTQQKSSCILGLADF